MNTRPLSGPHLKAAREALGQTLADASHATRIPEGRLLMLEQDNLAGFGSMAYARLFLKAYCAHLGLDASEALSHLPGPRPARMGAPGCPGCFHGGGHFPGRQPQARQDASTQQSWQLLRAAFLMTLLLAGLAGFWARHLTELSLATSAAAAAAGPPIEERRVDLTSLPQRPFPVLPGRGGDAGPLPVSRKTLAESGEDGLAKQLSQ